ncbi:hypothetical protein [Planctopirus hydrillae]|uniref:Uncharacterized protein n=1 Tax=Planctopirus hydrillae TaxID=1841610 RepID=A0A1C3EAD9_9PLAN|nr:hypothetical protein [Planctopirus hydrillae]ODA30179.1 hypothetical protein A6X21_06020 [Planctopirus hydrillae]
MMGQNQDGYLYAAYKQTVAMPLLFISILSGICAFVFFTDLYWWTLVPALICGLTGWASIILLISSSKVIEEEKKAKANAKLDEDPSVEPSSTAQLVEAEEKSGAIGVATALGVVALILVVGFKLVGKIDRFVNNRAAGDMEIKKAPAVLDKDLQDQFLRKNK